MMRLFSFRFLLWLVFALFALLGGAGVLDAAPLAARTRAIDLVRQASEMFTRKQYGQTLALCQQALRADPTYARAYNWMGATYQKQKQRENACAAFAQALKLEPEGDDTARAQRGLRELRCTREGHALYGLRVQALRTIPAHEATVRALAFSPDGKVLASAGADKKVALWNPGTGGKISDLKGHADEVTCLAFLDASTLASGDADGKVFLWDIAARRPTKLFDAGRNIAAMSLVPGTRTLVGGGGGGKIWFWDTIRNANAGAINGHDLGVLSLAVSGDGSRLVSASLDGSTRLWDVHTQKVARTLAARDLSYAVAFSPTGNGVLRDSSHGVQMRSLNGPVLRTLVGHRAGVLALAFARDKSTLASGSFDNTVCLWDARTGALLARASGHASSVRSVAFAPDGKLLASASQDRTIRFWRVVKQ